MFRRPEPAEFPGRQGHEASEPRTRPPVASAWDGGDSGEPEPTSSSLRSLTTGDWALFPPGLEISAGRREIGKPGSE